MGIKYPTIKNTHLKSNIMAKTKKKISNRKHGQYYLVKSLKLLKELGYQTMKLETNKMTYINGKPIWIHFDNFASDILAMNEKEIIFIQVKFLTDGKFSHMKQWKESYAKYKWPPFVKKELWLWEPRKKVRIEKVN